MVVKTDSYRGTFNETIKNEAITVRGVKTKIKGFMEDEERIQDIYTIVLQKCIDAKTVLEIDDVAKKHDHDFNFLKQSESAYALTTLNRLRESFKFYRNLLIKGSRLL